MTLGSEWVGGSRWIETLFWCLVSWGPARLASAEVVLGREMLARLIFHHGKCKVQERWDRARGRASVFLEIVSPMGEEPHKRICQKVFMYLEWLPGGTLERNKHLPSILMIFPVAKGCLINK